MGFWDRLFGRRSEPAPAPAPRRLIGGSASLSDEQALARYRYMMRTAPPGTSTCPATGVPVTSS